MFKQLFATMNEVLVEIAREYPNAKGARKTELDEQLAALRSMSDTCIEEWLLFEEQMGLVQGGTAVGGMTAAVKAAAATESLPAVKVAGEIPSVSLASDLDDALQKGQGYYKLHMFDQAAEAFDSVVRRQPDAWLARAYLAMSLLRCGQFAEAYRHFQLLLPLAESSKMKAISLSAMGCIQAEQHNYDKACEYFFQAYSADPSCVDPVLKTISWPRFT